MTEADVAAIVEGIAPVTCEAITRATAALVQRQTALELQVAHLVEAAKDHGRLHERVAVLETRAPVPGPPGPAGADGAPVDEARLRVAEMQLAGLAGSVTEIMPLRERVAVLETRAPVPGPPGPAGQDGTDGLGFDDLTVDQLDLRTIAVKAIRGAQVKTIGTVTFPVPAYRKIWLPDREYAPGDSVTWAGSIWYCEAATATKPGEGSKDWTLQCKRGKDGRDGTDGPPGPPGPPGKDWQQVYDDTRRR